MFTPRLDVLPASQRRLWAELSVVPTNFVLYGGTALALRLGHRQSVDFDFFSNSAFAPAELRSRIPFLRDATTQLSSPNTLVCLLERGSPVQIAFFGGLDLNRVNDPDVTANDVRVASLLDVAATKLKVILDRASLKDYHDIAALLDAGLTLPDMLAAARAIYGTSYNPLLSLKALTHFDDGDLNGLPRELRTRLARAAAAVNIGSLPSLPAARGLLPHPAA